MAICGRNGVAGTRVEGLRTVRQRRPWVSVIGDGGGNGSRSSGNFWREHCERFGGNIKDIGGKVKDMAGRRKYLAGRRHTQDKNTRSRRKRAK